MRHYRVQSIAPIGRSQVSGVAGSRLTPLDLWDLYTSRICLERKAREIQRTEKRLARERFLFVRPSGDGRIADGRRRRRSRSLLANTVTTRGRHQYGLAKRSFESFRRRLMLCPPWLIAPEFFVELGHWEIFFRTATMMDQGTFQRFTTWQARSRRFTSREPRLWSLAGKAKSGGREELRQGLRARSQSPVSKIEPPLHPGSDGLGSCLFSIGVGIRIFSPGVLSGGRLSPFTLAVRPF